MSDFTFTISTARLKELIRAAYADGWQDGQREPMRDEPTEDHWVDSVSCDELRVLRQRLRDGGKP